MEFSTSVNNLFNLPISKINCNLLPDGIRFDRRPSVITSTVAEVIDRMGIASAKAQGLMKPITSADKLRNSEHNLYIFVDHEDNGGKGSVVGILKVGWKRLFMFDREGQCHDTNALCVLDFYVHESRQRHGCGKTLFEHMLKEEKVIPDKLAIDKPSDKFLSFLRKHYNLVDVIPQTNNFVVYEGFFCEKASTAEPDSSSDPLNRRSCGLDRPAIKTSHRRYSSLAYSGRHAAQKPEATIAQIIHSSPLL